MAVLFLYFGKVTTIFLVRKFQQQSYKFTNIRIGIELGEDKDFPVSLLITVRERAAILGQFKCSFMPFIVHVTILF